VYFGMAFSFLVEVLNMMRIKREKKHIVKLNTPTLEDKKVDNYSDTAH
jgi:hypothetical protein